VALVALGHVSLIIGYPTPMRRGPHWKLDGHLLRWGLAGGSNLLDQVALHLLVCISQCGSSLDTPRRLARRIPSNPL